MITLPEEIPLGKATDLSKNKYGALQPIYRVKNNGKNTAWLCKCDCGNYVVVDAGSLTAHRQKSCGCNYIKEKRADEYTQQQIGQKIGHWTIIGRGDKDKTWLCECDCENHTVQSMKKTEMRRSLGCKYCSTAPTKLIDLTGKKFGHWLVLKKGLTQKGHTMWECECDCPSHTIRLVDGYKLRNGISTSCGCDTNSKGERKISQLLTENNLAFECEKRFDTCLSNKDGQMRFDFYVNNQYLIEFDGWQHSKETDTGWSSKERIRITQERDEIKNQWCKENNIILIRIPYWHLKNLSIKDLMPETSQFIVI